ncbi:hypothetical protein V2G26_000104, partial [Clonostachys chloroleuca]
MAGQLGNIPRDLSNGDNVQKPSRIDVQVSEQDLSRIWQWNAIVPERVDACVHDLISQSVHRQPEAPAVCAWDGSLTYRELDDLSSQLAYRLIGLGVGPNIFVPLCFEKSMWTAVAMLAVMRAGGASVGMDITQPEERLHTIVSQANPHVILASETHQVIAQRLAKCNVVVVSERHLKQSHSSLVLELPRISPSSALYLVYTSGSTGTPKGVIVTHSNFSSAIKHQRDALGFTTDSRVFDFASYAFDMAWYNFIYTLSVGGCLCVPSEDERKNDVAGCIQRYRISYAFFTPTLARVLGRRVLSSLSVLVFAGEPVLPSDTTLCGLEGRTIISYGPAECTPGSTVAQITTTPAGPVVGKGYGVVTWVVDPVHPDRLVPIGEVGELWLEGPLLGDGYLDDPERTTAAFTNDTPWLMEGGPACSGRRGRLYKTGDLVRYQADGSLAFVGRKDTQVKIRGQRVELGEVEHHVQELLKWSDIDGDVDKTTLTRVVAEVIVPKGSNTPTLVIFICLDTGFPDEEARNRTIQKMTAGIDKRLASKIPVYMIPTSYIPIDALPMTATGKTDRRKLRELGSLLTQRQLNSLTRPNHSSRPVSTDMEKKLQALWALVLDIEATSISADDSFLRLGGDSVRAMQLVGIAREHGLSFSVADLFNHPRLESLASITKTKAISHSETIPAFSLLKSHQSVEDVQSQAAAMCGVNVADIQDIFPCTPLQEGLMALTGRRKGDYVASITLELDEMTDAQRLRNAWEQVAAAAPILRTRIVDIPQQGLVQVILHENVEWEVVDELETYLDDARRKEMGLGTRLSRFRAAFEASSSSPRYLVWTIHHALYDGWSMRLIMNALKDAYQTKAIPCLQPFQTFVKHLADTEETAAASFWRGQYTGLEAAQFPALPSSGYHPRPTSKLTSIIESLEWGSTEITGSNLIRAAWSILISNYTGSSDVIFGTTIAGRQSPIAGIERIAAPTISTVPLRIAANPLETVNEILAKVQKQAVDMIPFEHTGLQRIRQASADAQEACCFQTLIVVQPHDENDESNAVFRSSSSSEDSNIEYNALLSYALVVECRLGAKGMRLDVNFDEKVIESKRVSFLLQQFQYILQQICEQENGERRLQDVEVINNQDLATIWDWNDKPSESINSCAHDLFLQAARRQPDAEAVCAWDGRLTYAQLDNYSNTLASHLVSTGIGANVRVPLCLEKSAWTPVAMLAVIKAGGIAVAMDITQPEARLCTSVKQSKAKHILSSASAETLANRLGDCLVITVCQETLNSLQSQPPTPLPPINPSDALCILFTSGSTGAPKGTTLTHSNFSTGIEQQIRAFGIQPSSRVYDFASYAFDFAWSNLLLPLSVGGSICIPSEEQRKNEIAESINQLGANFAFFTPSVARVLDPTTLPNLKRLVVGGEAVQRNDFYHWPSRIKLLNIYGPSECTVMATYTDIRPGQENDGTIGKGAGSTTWVVQPSGQNLSPIGAVGELYLEGPLVGIGYLEDAERTASSFLEDPPWLCRGGPGHLGRRGRVYRTGDLVRYNTDGSLVFVGRRDTQVKLRGQRIELQEVEHHVQSLLATDNKSGIQIVAEIIEPEGSRNPTLVAFVHSMMSHNHLGAADEEVHRNAVRKMTDGIEDRLGENVPVYMIPTAFIPLQSIPMTASGKTDRRRLRELGVSMYSAHRVQRTKNGYRPPSSELENVLQTIWSDVLNIPQESIAIDTAFTRLGGDSISSMQVVSRCRAKNISITTSDILRSKTIEKLALCCKEVKPKSVIAEESTEETLWHLSPVQQMFFEFHPQGLDHFNQSFMLKLKAPVSDNVLSAAIGATVSRHPMLRARFWPDSNGCWQQLVVKDSQHAFAFERHVACQRSEVQALAKARQESLSILSGPVFAADVFSIPGEEQSLLLTAHHLIIDLMSWRIIWHDIEQHIRAGEGSGFAPEPFSFQAWSKVQRHTSRSLQPEQVLPSHITAPDFGFWGLELGENDSASCRSYVESLDERTTGLLLGQSNDCYRTEPVDILLAALTYSFQQVFTDRHSPPIFLEGHGREPPADLQVDLSETVGWFTSMHPVDAPIAADDSILTAIQSVKDYRRRVPGKGQPYFAYRYHTEGGRRVFDSHREMEVILNYTGRFQQLESDNGLFQPEDRLELVSGIEEVSPKAQRFSLVEVSADIRQGRLALSFYINKRMNHQGRLEDWAKLTQHNLNLAVHQLANTEPTFTLSDFSLLSTTNLSLERLLRERLLPIGVNSSDILDIYPCTPIQEGILLSREKEAASYANFWVWNCIPSFDEDSVSPDRLEEAWRLVASQHSILSTIFTEQLDGGGFVQVLLSNPQCRVVRMDTLSAPPADALLKVESPAFSAGQPSHTFTIACNSDGHVACRLDISHLLIDASSLHILLKSLAHSYQGQAIERAPQFRTLVAHLRHQAREEKLAFWTNSLSQARPCRLVTAPAYGSLANTDRSLHGMITIPAENAAGIDLFSRSKGITRSVFLQVAWSLVLSRFTGMSDITFGYMASGRDAPIRNIENMIGPLINLLISRIDLNENLDNVLVKTSENSIEQLRFQHSSLADIQHALSMGSEQLFNTALTVREQFLYESTREIRFDETYGHDPHE